MYPTHPGQTKQTLRVHKLVAEAFIENPDNKPYVDHINRITTDNKATNLRWVTPIENSLNSGKQYTDSYGISYNKETDYFMVCVRVSGGRKYIGRRRTFEEAKQLRDATIASS